MTANINTLLPSQEDRAEWRAYLRQKFGPDAGRDARLDAIDADLDRPIAEANPAVASETRRAVDHIQRECPDRDDAELDWLIASAAACTTEKGHRTNG